MSKQTSEQQDRELAELLNWIGFPDGPPPTVTLKQPFRLGARVAS